LLLLLFVAVDIYLLLLLLMMKNGTAAGYFVGWVLPPLGCSTINYEITGINYEAK
jgi:hypothetical protein